MGNMGIAMIAIAGGFIAGILLAPKSGKETRKDIMEKRHELAEKAKKDIAEMRKSAANIKDDLVSGTESIKDAARDTAKNIGEEVSVRTESMKKRAA